MSCIHRLLNALLRGLVISAVLGSVRSYSNGLPSRPSDAAASAAASAAAAANVATTGKLQAIYHTTGLGVEGGGASQFKDPCTLPPPPPSSSSIISLWLFLGKAGGSPTLGSPV